VVRLWSIHPRHLDAAGLVAVWREGLLARAVLRGVTVGYRHHPQLARFRAARSPILLLDSYLSAVCDEADCRGYAFDRSKLGRRRAGGRVRITVTRGQLEYEWKHLKKKLKARNRTGYLLARTLRIPEVHPLFRMIEGPVESWERRLIRR
jgi:hypothetical protein